MKYTYTVEFIPNKNEWDTGRVAQRSKKVFSSAEKLFNYLQTVDILKSTIPDSALKSLKDFKDYYESPEKDNNMFSANFGKPKPRGEREDILVIQMRGVLKSKFRVIINSNPINEPSVPDRSQSPADDLPEDDPFV